MFKLKERSKQRQTQGYVHARFNNKNYNFHKVSKGNQALLQFNFTNTRSLSCKVILHRDISDESRITHVCFNVKYYKQYYVQHCGLLK